MWTTIIKFQRPIREEVVVQLCKQESALIKLKPYQRVTMVISIMDKETVIITSLYLKVNNMEGICQLIKPSMEQPDLDN